LSVSCAATPALGRTPLTVSFSVSVSGAQGAASVRINYGDGTTGADVNAPHTYTGAGAYTASFDVATATQSALCSTPVRVEAAPAPTPAPTPPPSTANHAPTAVFNTTPDPDASDVFYGVPTFTITFNLCRTTDPENDPLNFRMDLDGDGVFEVDGPTGADCRRTHSYGEFGVFVPRVCVTDLLPSLSPAHSYQCRNYVVRLE
jgi:hypothetical protein